jgi:hypothetical protein
MVEMLREFEGQPDERAIEEEYRPAGSPQNNVLLRYVEAIEHETGGAALEGFTAVLSDFIACTVNGVVPGVEQYEKLDLSTSRKSP